MVVVVFCDFMGWRYDVIELGEGWKRELIIKKVVVMIIDSCDYSGFFVFGFYIVWF